MTKAYHNSELVQLVMNFIYEPSEKKKEAKLEKIIESNSFFDQDLNMAFMYKGEVYTSKNHYYPRGRVKLLHKSLNAEMDCLIKEMRELQQEKDAVRSYLVCIMLISIRPADLKVMLPDFLHPAIKDLHSAEGTSFITQEDLDLLQKNSASIIASIKQRLILNLIS